MLNASFFVASSDPRTPYLQEQTPHGGPSLAAFPTGSGPANPLCPVLDPFPPFPACRAYWPRPSLPFPLFSGQFTGPVRFSPGHPLGQSIACSFLLAPPPPPGGRPLPAGPTRFLSVFVFGWPGSSARALPPSVLRGPQPTVSSFESGSPFPAFPGLLVYPRGPPWGCLGFLCVGFLPLVQVWSPPGFPLHPFIWPSRERVVACILPPAPCLFFPLVMGPLAELPGVSPFSRAGVRFFKPLFPGAAAAPGLSSPPPTAFPAHQPPSCGASFFFCASVASSTPWPPVAKSRGGAEASLPRLLLPSINELSCPQGPLPPLPPPPHATHNPRIP